MQQVTGVQDSTCGAVGFTPVLWAELVWPPPKGRRCSRWGARCLRQLMVELVRSPCLGICAYLGGSRSVELYVCTLVFNHTIQERDGRGANKSCPE